MRIEKILVIAPKLSGGEFVVPQPSLEQLIREHYARIDMSGDGQVLADRYIEVLKEQVGDGPAEIVPEDTAGQAPQERVAPDEAAMRSFTVALISYHASTYNGASANALQLDRIRLKWSGDERVTAQYPILTKTDVQGGFSNSDESRQHIGSVARRLASEGLILKTPEGGFLPLRSDPETPSDSPAEEERQPEPSPFAELRAFGAEIGLGGALPILTGLAGIAGLAIGAMLLDEDRKE